VRKCAYLHGYRAWKPRSDRHSQYQPYTLINIHTKIIGQSGVHSTRSRTA
jgi:hypothetical protein